MKRLIPLMAVALFAFTGTQLAAQTGEHSCTGQTSATKECSHHEKKACCKKEGGSCEGHEHAKTEKIEFSTVTKQELRDLMEEEGIYLVDARGAESFQKGHIDNAVHVGNFTAPEDRNARIIAYCGGPKCGAAPKFARSLINDGYTNVSVFTGGWLEWNSSEEGQASL